MVQQKGQHRVATLLAADIVGFSTMMSTDEPATTALVEEHHREVIGPAIREHGGWLAKDTGNGFLAEFDSPAEAVRCAVAIQQSMLRRNLDRSLRIVHRIGITVGETVGSSGNGVEVAMRRHARLSSAKSPKPGLAYRGPAKA